MSEHLSYAKTPKGVEEMTSRSHGLPQRVRRLLILVDGKRDFASIAAAFPGEDTQAVLEALVADGFIAPLASPPRVQAKGSRALAPAPAPADDAERLTMARNFMANTVNAFLGVMGSSLIDKIERSDTLEELRGEYDAWRKAIRLSREGKAQAEDLERRLAALLS
jgi:hypothetical protein